MSVILVNEKYYELIDSQSPTAYSFTDGGSSTVMSFLIPTDKLFDFIQDVLGYAILKNNSYLSRPVIPMSCPIWPWMYASAIADIKGISANGEELSTDVQENTAYKNIQTEKPPYVGSYKYWQVSVRFTSRDYAVYTDEQLNPHIRLNQKYYMPVRLNYEGDWGQNEETWIDRFQYANFTNWKYTPNIEMLTYGSGNFWQKRGIGIPLGTPKELPISNENGGSNFMKIVKGTISYNWFQVPFQMTVQNRLWNDCFSKINSEEFATFPKGTLLFTGVNVQKYPPNYPFETINLTAGSSVYDYYTEFYKNQYADVTFNFSYMNYPADTRFQQAPNTVFQLDCKDPQSFHNRLLYQGNRLWYYTESAPAIAVRDGAGGLIGYVPNQKAAPTYWSIPMGLLFNYIEGA